MRYFQTSDGKRIRFLPHENNLYRGDTSVDTSVNKSMSLLEDKENMSCFDELSNLPDNSSLQCNLCVTGLDESLTSEDLHLLFQ